MHQDNGLTPKQQRFAEEYLLDLNATAAAKRAGYSAKTAESQGARLLSNAKVQAFIQVNRQKTTEKLEDLIEKVDRELGLMALARLKDCYDASGNLLLLHEMPEGVQAALEGLESDELTSGSGENRVAIGQRRKVKLASKRGVVELFYRRLGLLKDKSEVTVSPLTTEEIARRLNALGVPPPKGST